MQEHQALRRQKVVDSLKERQEHTVIYVLTGQVSGLSVMSLYLLVLFYLCVRRLIGLDQLKLCTVTFLTGISNRKISDS